MSKISPDVVHDHTVCDGEYDYVAFLLLVMIKSVADWKSLSLI